MGGQGFDLLIEEHAAVSAGDPVIAWDPAEVEAGGRSAICPVVAMDAIGSELSRLAVPGEIAAGELLFVWG